MLFDQFRRRAVVCSRSAAEKPAPLRAALLSGALLWLAPPALAQQFTQQGPKLVGSGAVGLPLQGWPVAQQGWSVALSEDGNTAIIGGPFDNNAAGAAWVFTRNGWVWTQQGKKLVGQGSAGEPNQGFSVALSRDGNTAIVGGPTDGTIIGTGIGAAWVFTRSGGVWTQQGNKLVGTGAVGFPQQGWSVALSGDGKTAFMGGPLDAGQQGAVWVFTCSTGIFWWLTPSCVWTQQGSKLVGTGAVGGFPQQGWSVALSGSGNTAILGGRGDNFYFGAAWVFTCSPTGIFWWLTSCVWTQQGSKLVGTGAVGAAPLQGNSVAISSCNVALVGGNDDNNLAGAVWVFGERPIC